MGKKHLDRVVIYRAAEGPLPPVFGHANCALGLSGSLQYPDVPYYSNDDTPTTMGEGNANNIASSPTIHCGPYGSRWLN